MILYGQLKYLVLWLPSYYIIKDLRYLQSPSYKLFVSTFGPIIVVCWYPTWVLAADIPLKRLVLYYAKNPHLFRRYAKIYKPLKDIIIEIAKRSKPYEQGDQLGKALEYLLKEILRRRVYKRKINSTINRDPKRSKV